MNKIYKISNDFDDNLYIGKTSRSLIVRLKEHERNASGCKKSYIHNAIQAHGIEHFTITLIEDNIPDELIDEKEKYWIAYYDSYKNGYNLTPGGEGHSLSDEDIKAIRNLWEQGYSITEISELLEMSRSTVYHRVCLYPDFDVKENRQRSIARFSKAIDQYTENKEYIQSFPSINEASRQLNIDAKLISACILNHYKCKGFYFCEKDQPLIIKTNKKIVGQFNSNTGELIQIFNGAREAARQMSVDSSCIIKACNSNDKKKSKGFIWRYLE